MMSVLKSLSLGVCVAAALLFSPVKMAGASAGIAVIVNDGIITHHDINERMKLIIASSGLPNNKDTRNKLKSQVVDSLIEEALQVQEAERLEVSLSDEKLEAGFADVARQNKISADEFRAKLKASGGSVDSLMDQIEARLSWTEVFSRSMRRRVSVSDIDVDTALQRAKDNVGKTEYLLYEIYLPVASPSEDASVRGLAQKVLRDITQNGVPFSSVAKQLSKAPGAQQNGGALGWVQVDQLDKKLQQPVASMKAKTLSVPIRSLRGYHIFYMANKRKVKADSLPNRDALRSQLFMKRAERLSRARLKSLRRDAYIDNRLED